MNVEAAGYYFGNLGQMATRKQGMIRYAYKRENETLRTLRILFPCVARYIFIPIFLWRKQCNFLFFFNRKISFDYSRNLLYRICQRYIAVREPHRHSYKKVVDINYDAICEDGKICKKTKQGYQTIYRIVYRTAYKCASDVQ